MNEKSKRRIGVFGGSFDPVHIGHVIIAQDAVEQLELDRLIFVPAAVSPFKQDRTPTGGCHRLEMLRRATASNLRFEVSDLEMKRGGVSYTIETIRQLQRENSESELFFILGLDSMKELHRWYGSDELLECCTVVPFGRGGQCPGKTAAESGLSSYWKKKLFDRLIQVHQIEISASEIRMRVAEGLSIQTLVLPEVEMYIAEHHLYA